MLVRSLLEVEFYISDVVMLLGQAGTKPQSAECLRTSNEQVDGKRGNRSTLNEPIRFWDFGAGVPAGVPSSEGYRPKH